MTRDENIHYCVTHNFINTLNEWNDGTDNELQLLVIEAVKKVRLSEMTINYLIKTKSFVFNDLSYSLSDENRGDINGMITLERDSFIGTIDANGNKNLTPHNLVELIALFNAMADYLIDVKGLMYIKQLQLEALTTIEDINNFNIEI